MIHIDFNRKEVLNSLSKLLCWFETIEQKDGLYGPVVHFWGNSINYCGPGMDWRLEGYLLALLNLFKTTKDKSYFKKIFKYIKLFEKFSYKDGSLRNSHFQANPVNIGTPHEAAAYYALSEVGNYLKDESIFTDRRESIKKLVGKYVDDFLIKKLWNITLECFNDWPYSIFDIVTPNKIATIINLLISYQKLTNNDYSYYIVSSANWIIKKQKLRGKAKGGICQTHGKYENLFFPFYNARCVIPLNKAYEISGNKKYLDCKNQIINFIIRNSLNNGFKQIVVSDAEDIDNPIWIAGMGDILYALLNCDEDNILIKKIIEKNIEFLISQQLNSGGFPSAQGFDIDKRSFKDIIPVAGWNDKILFFFSEIIKDKSKKIPKSTIKEESTICSCNDKEALYIENNDKILIKDKKFGEHLYLWNKKDLYPKVNLTEEY